MRHNRSIKRRMLVSFVLLYALLGIFGIGFPLLNLWLASTSNMWVEAIIVMIFFLCKFVWEKIGAKISVILGADAMPNVVLMSSFAYEVNMNISLASGLGAPALSELLVLPALVHAHCLVSLHMSRGEASTEAKDTYIVATLLVRGFSEMVASCTFLFHIVLVWYVYPQLNHLVCRLTDEEFRHIVLSNLGLMGV